ncbi:hypothetical protein, partial [Kocuria sp. KH4]
RVRISTDSPLPWKRVRIPARAAGLTCKIRRRRRTSAAGLSLTRTDAAQLRTAQVMETPLWWTMPVNSTQLY